MKIKKQFSLLFAALSVLLLPVSSVVAQVSSDLIKSTATTAGIELTTVPIMIGSIIKLVLSFVGTIFFAFVIYSGVQWMTAGGEEEKITKAKDRIINSSIGLAITGAAYFITWFISKTILPF
jgi:lysylphosphatidylglycerol synthetase-like protein (DUF2156 family)